MNVELVSAVTATLQDLVWNRGFQLPIHVAIIAVNGAIYGGTYVEAEYGLDFKPAIDHSPTGVFAVPVNIIFVDSRGEAARVVITNAGQTLPEILN